MRLMLDTHFVIGLVDRPPRIGRDEKWATVQSPDTDLVASTASLWEIAIKTRLGKLPIYVSPSSIPEALEQLGIPLLVIDHRHVLAELDTEPRTRDPFDRLLLAQCQIENLRLVTQDRALASHPLAWRER